MASKRSRRGRRLGPPRYFYFQWDEERRVRRERELAREAMRWDEDRIRRFAETQRHKREWISFVEIADWYSELGGPANPKKAAAAREQAYKMLEQDLLAGLFEKGGRSQVLFRFPGVNLAHGKMTRKRLQEAIDNNIDGEHGRLFLKHCWLPRNLFERWCAWHHLPKSPPRFKAPQESPARLSPEAAGRTPPQPSKPSKPSNRGGRPPAVDWEALKDALREEIKNLGYPEPRNLPGWRGTKDVVEWALKKLGKEGEDVSHRTIEDNVRRIIRELKVASTAKPVSR